jgi:hypothetical protein
MWGPKLSAHFTPLSNVTQLLADLARCVLFHPFPILCLTTPSNMDQHVIAQHGATVPLPAKAVD